MDCPISGVQLNDAILFIFTATLLATFDIQKAVENGIVVEPGFAFTNGALM